MPSRVRPAILIQVCESIAEPQTRKREVAALVAAMAELKIKSAIIVTRSDGDRIETDEGTIEVLPIWKFLLDLPVSKE